MLLQARVDLALHAELSEALLLIFALVDFADVLRVLFLFSVAIIIPPFVFTYSLFAHTDFIRSVEYLRIHARFLSL